MQNDDMKPVHRKTALTQHWEGVSLLATVYWKIGITSALQITVYCIVCMHGVHCGPDYRQIYDLKCRSAGWNQTKHNRGLGLAVAVKQVSIVRRKEKERMPWESLQSNIILTADWFHRPAGEEDEVDTGGFGSVFTFFLFNLMISSTINLNIENIITYNYTNYRFSPKFIDKLWLSMSDTIDIFKIVLYTSCFLQWKLMFIFCSLRKIWSSSWKH